MARGFLLVCAIAFGLALALTTGGAVADEPALCPQVATAGTQIAEGTAEGDVLVCCFEGLADESCGIKVPTRNGCEWTMAYQCPDAAYTCDDEAKFCKCDAAGAGVAP